MCNSYRSVMILFCLCSVVFLDGCAFSTLEKELTKLKQVKVLVGKITSQTQPNKNVLIFLYEETTEGHKISQASILDSELGWFVLEVQTGIYYLLAFEDLNNNLSYDENEPFGYYGNPDAIVISDKTPETWVGFDISMNAASRFPESFPKEINLSANILRSSFVKMGQLISFDDPLLAQEFGNKGYWEPLTFLREVGFSIFFKEKYDAGKTPVLFVHGAVGTPLGWENTVKHMDLNRFQPWFYYYPSGLPLNKVSFALNQMILALHGYYNFEKLYVVAHSMGGLVARSFILQNSYESRQDFIKLFVSISTPWNGHRMSAKGIQQAPTAVPSWYDMVPDSEFIKSLYQRRLPGFVKHYLFFSYKGDRSLYLANNDGTVELSSELDIRAQAEAERLFGYDEDHSSILNSEEVLLQINRLMSNYN